MAEFAADYGPQILFAVLSSVVTGLWAAMGVWHKKQQALENGVQALLRDRLIQSCEHYLDQGAVPVYGMENIDQMYSAYHTLGGNGAVTKLVCEARYLPTRH